MRVLLGSARTKGRYRSVLDQPPGDQPMEGTGSPAVPCPAGAPRPGALQGADRRLYLLHVLPAEPPLIHPGAAGLARVRRPDALLRHDYRSSRQDGPRRDLRGDVNEAADVSIGGFITQLLG